MEVFEIGAAFVLNEHFGLMEQIEDGKADHNVLAVLPGEGAVARRNEFVIGRSSVQVRSSAPY